MKHRSLATLAALWAPVALAACAGPIVRTPETGPAAATTAVAEAAPAAADAKAAATAADAAATAAVADTAGAAAGAQSIEQLFRDRETLGGKEVTVRGTVVKFKAGIMGKNWLHLQDGTGAAGSNDLTVTTAADTEVGKKVLVKGVAAVNKDFGYGYKYDLIVEDATVTAE